MGVKREVLENGNVLRALIVRFLNEESRENLIPVLSCLRDSFVWIPGHLIMSDEDMEKFANGKEGDIISNSSDMKFEPDILQNGEAKFFPVFSSVEEMGEYGNGFSKMQRHFFEAMSYTMGKEETVGIVVNAFSTPFIVPKEWFDIIGEIPTNIDEE